MHHPLRLGPIIAFCCALLALVPAAPASPPPAADVFFRPLLMDAPKLSPDGKHLAFLLPNKENNAALMTLDLGSKTPRAISGGGKFDVYHHDWLDEQTLVFNVSQWKLYAYGIFIADRDQMQAVPLHRYEVTDIVSLPKDKPGHVLVSLEERPGRKASLVLMAAARVKGTFLEQDPDRAIVRHFPRPPGEVLHWIADPRGWPLASVAHGSGANRLWHYREETTSWHQLQVDLDQVVPLAAQEDGSGLYVASYGEEDTLGLYTYDFATGTMSECLFRDGAFDFSSGRLVFSRKGILTGVVYRQDAPVSRWFDPLYRQVQATVDQQFPGRTNELIDADEPANTFLIRSSTARHPGIYYLLDVAQKSLTKLYDPAPWIVEEQMRPMHVIRYQARDGTALQGYLTLPHGAAPEQPPPLVVLPHGGPWIRDVWGFDPEVQFLASRGYAVFQPNYRGSAGFGRQLSFELMGDFTGMHHDVTDGVKALIKAGHADPRRIAIMGASFGGYLALCGAAFEPNLYRCAITAVGVFDWAELMKNRRRQRAFAAYEFMRRKIGDPASDAERFEAISPIHHVDQIKVPIFVAHGKSDNNVSVSQSRRLVSELRRNGVPHETFFREWEGHGFFNHDTKIEYYRKVESFLARHLR